MRYSDINTEIAHALDIPIIFGVDGNILWNPPDTSDLYTFSPMVDPAWCQRLIEHLIGTGGTILIEYAKGMFSIRLSGATIGGGPTLAKALCDAVLHI